MDRKTTGGRSMDKESSLSLPSPLESVQYQFETWRENKKTPRKPIPEHLWEAASKLQKDYPISHISKVLRLNHTDLKNRISGQDLNRQRTKPSSAQFIELDCLPSFTVSECIVELEDAGGSKMRMSFKGKADLDLLELSKAFWRKAK
jgi:hypothetical protein